MMHGLAFSSAAVCLTYTAVLDLFRLSVFENDSIFLSFLEIMSCGGLFLLAHYSDGLLKSFRSIAQLSIVIASAGIIYRMKDFYVSGARFPVVNLDGKVFIITGSNTGLGFETAKQIVIMGGTVVLACRSVEKAKAAQESIISISRCSPTKVLVLKLDLCGFDSVRKFVKEFRSLSLPLNCLINNAGVMMQDRELTQDGFEMVFTANHLSHFLLTNLLMPDLEKTSGRVVNVTSSLHKSLKSFDFTDVMSERSYSIFGTYAQSKLANILFTTELQKRLTSKGSKVTCNAVHPGCVNTEVTRNMSSLMQFLNFIVSPLLKALRKTPLEGAYTSIFVATSPDVQTVGGKYFFHCKPILPGACATRADDSERLWKLSEKLTGLTVEKQDVSSG